MPVDLLTDGGYQTFQPAPLIPVAGIRLVAQARGPTGAQQSGQLPSCKERALWDGRKMGEDRSTGEAGGTAAQALCESRMGSFQNSGSHSHLQY